MRATVPNASEAVKRGGKYNSNVINSQGQNWFGPRTLNVYGKKGEPMCTCRYDIRKKQLLADEERITAQLAA